MYHYYEPAPTNGVEFMGIWGIVSLILAIVGGLVLYFLFFKPDKKVENKYFAWAKEFFNFRKMLIEDMLKVLYLVLTIFITLYSLALISVSFISFLLVLIVGNVVLRLSFEGALLIIMIWKNTNEINKRLKK